MRLHRVASRHDPRITMESRDLLMPMAGRWDVVFRVGWRLGVLSYGVMVGTSGCVDNTDVLRFSSTN